jgi:hypothetical protein
VSSNIEVNGTEVPRGMLTRIASDHFPLVADLTLARAVAKPLEFLAVDELTK